LGKGPLVTDALGSESAIAGANSVAIERPGAGLLRALKRIEPHVS
jgi:hypothetical protein